MSRYRWRDSRTLDIKVRRGDRFSDGAELEAHSVRRSFEEQIRWVSRDPPGTHLNIDQRTRPEVMDRHTLRLDSPSWTAVGKLRATHVMNERFWRDLGFGYARDQSGEGHW
jgi:hypothetical protein